MSTPTLENGYYSPPETHRGGSSEIPRNNQKRPHLLPALKVLLEGSTVQVGQVDYICNESAFDSSHDLEQYITFLALFRVGHNLGSFYICSRRRPRATFEDQECLCGGFVVDGLEDRFGSRFGSDFGSDFGCDFGSNFGSDFDGDFVSRGKTRCLRGP